jgi:hypothetical protein
MFQMKFFPAGLNALILAALAGAVTGGLAQAQSANNAGVPSIMAPEPGSRPEPRPRHRQTEPSAPSEARPAVPVRRARGSSSPSPVPRYQSPPDVDFTPPRTPKAPTLTQAPAVPTPVPGFVTVPPPPTSLSGAGQTFQDKAIGCAHYGATQGVGAGQIGAYTGGCVNTR